jgi:phage terminase large subunit
MDDKALQAALWYKQLCESNNAVFLPLFFDHHRHLILMGGGGSGKSIFAGRKVLERCATEPGHRMLVVRKVAKTLRESCFDQLKAQAMQYYGPAIRMIPRGKSGDMYITFTNGSEILFAGLDDVEKLKSIHDISGIWIEEASELLEGDFNQLDIRLRGERKYYKQIIISFNPISITHWLKKRFFDRKDARVVTSRTTYKDNRFLPEEDRLTLEAFRETDPYYYQVYCLGQWGVLSQTIFWRAILMDRLLHCKKPIRRGRFAYRYDETAITDAAFTDAEDGETLVWEEPKAGHPYVIGADTAGEGSDWFVACVIDNSTGRLVAKYRTRTDEDLFAREVWCLGMWYNQALVGIELCVPRHARCVYNVQPLSRVVSVAAALAAVRHHADAGVLRARSLAQVEPAVCPDGVASPVSGRVLLGRLHLVVRHDRRAAGIHRLAAGSVHAVARRAGRDRVAEIAVCPDLAGCVAPALADAV